MHTIDFYVKTTERCSSGEFSVQPQHLRANSAGQPAIFTTAASNIMLTTIASGGGQGLAAMHQSSQPLFKNNTTEVVAPITP